jgi:DNA-binding response OmpR family regulator
MLGPMARVLLVDDDPAILRLLEVNFRLEGFETVTASRGEQALEAAAASRPDAIVLDVMLPGLDGTEVFRRLREDETLASVPVVFLSARSRDDDLVRADQLDATYVTKPFDPSALVETVRDLIDRGGSA